MASVLPRRVLLLGLLFISTILLWLLLLRDQNADESSQQDGFQFLQGGVDKFNNKSSKKRSNVITDEVIAKFNARRAPFRSHKEECQVIHLNFSLYPSSYGMEACERIEIKNMKSTPRYGIICNSSGIISLATFVKSRRGQQLACFFKSKKFKCYPRPHNLAVCGCNVNCTETSILNNLPIEGYKPSRRVMSFNIFGNNTEYSCGVLRQIRLAKLFFPDFASRVYLNSSIPSKIVAKIRKEAEVIEIPNDSPFANSGAFWRFMIADGDNDVDIYCIRDADAVFNFREATAVYKWIDSGIGFNLMRDHKHHTGVFLAGAWCGRRKIKNIKQMMLQWKRRSVYGDDQEFLKMVIMPLIKNDILTYDSCKYRRIGKNEIGYPSDRIGCEWVGVRYRKNYEALTKYQYTCYEDTPNLN